MGIAVAEALLKLGDAASAHDFTVCFVAAFQRDPREGYAGRFHEFLFDGHRCGRLPRTYPRRQ
jgi:hypothetical protein